MKREEWSSKLMYIMTVAGATIGFGATWRFPYMVGQNGGGAYLLVFLVAMFLLGVPLLAVESVIGRRRQKNVIDAFSFKEDDKKVISKWWQAIGLIGILGAFGILAYYMVLGGWVLGYIVNVVTGGLNLSSNISEKETLRFFNNLVGNAYEVILYTILFVVINYYILVKGVIEGIEKAMKYLMPLLLLLIIVMIIRALTLDGVKEGLKFYLYPDFSKITAGTFLLALGQVFFALSLGFGVIITLSSYLNKKENIMGTSITTIIINTIIPLMIGFIIFPAIFTFNVDPTSGPSLIFEVLPMVFSKIWLGNIFAVCFFVLLLIAALTSSLSIYEVVITTLIEKTKMTRKKATIITLAVIFLLGNLPSLLAYSALEDVKILGKNIFDFFDYFSANILFTSEALLCSIFIGFVLKGKAINEVTNEGKVNLAIANTWFLYTKYIVPILIIFMFIISL